MPRTKWDGFSKFTNNELHKNEEFLNDVNECLYDMLVLNKFEDKDFTDV